MRYPICFFLLNIMEGHNRRLLSGKDVCAIFAASPCAGLFSNNPDDVQRWVVTVEQPQPITTLTNLMGTVPAYLHSQLVQYTGDGMPWPPAPNWCMASLYRGTSCQCVCHCEAGGPTQSCSWQEVETHCHQRSRPPPTLVRRCNTTPVL